MSETSLFREQGSSPGIIASSPEKVAAASADFQILLARLLRFLDIDPGVLLSPLRATNCRFAGERALAPAKSVLPHLDPAPVKSGWPHLGPLAIQITVSLLPSLIFVLGFAMTLRDLGRRLAIYESAA